MRQIRPKAVVVTQPAGERFEQADRKLLFGTAAAAHEVAVTLSVGSVPARDAVVEVRVGHVAELLERFEVPVDGGGIDLRVTCSDAGRDLVRRHVMTRTLQRIQNEPALDGHAFAAGVQPLVNTH